MVQIRSEIRRGLETGAVGLSTGMDYIVQCYATTDELVAACSVMAGLDAPYVSHIRYKTSLLPAIAEAIEIGRRAGVPVHISHLKTQDPITPEQVFELLDDARSDVDVTFDVYPYQPGSTMLNYLLPYEAWEDGPLGVLAKLNSPIMRERIAASIRSYRLDTDHIRIAWLPGSENASWIGKTLAEYVTASEKPLADAVCDLLIEERLAVLCVFDEGDDVRVRPFLVDERFMLGSDGIFFPDGRVHPRVYGSAARLLGRCVRDWKLFTLEDAVHKMTERPARRFGLRDRGRIQQGCFADLVVFDEAKIDDPASYENPHQPAQGVHEVVVNGVPIVRDQMPLDNPAKPLPGRFLRSRQ